MNAVPHAPQENVLSQENNKPEEKMDKSEAKEKKKDGRAKPRSKEQMEAFAKARIALNESKKRKRDDVNTGKPVIVTKKRALQVDEKKRTN